MAKLKPWVITIGLALTSVSAFADHDNAPWGGKELKIASAAALDHFKAENGEALFDTVKGVTLEVNSQGIAAKARITYVQDEQKKTVSYFCHVHDVDIDCH